MSEDIKGQIKDLREITNEKDPIKIRDAEVGLPNIQEDASKLADEMERVSGESGNDNS